MVGRAKKIFALLCVWGEISVFAYSGWQKNSNIYQLNLFFLILCFSLLLIKIYLGHIDESSTKIIYNLRKFVANDIFQPAKLKRNIKKRQKLFEQN